MMAVQSSTGTKSRENATAREFRGFEPLTGNFLYCPNQFFDVCLPHHSRGVVRLVAYLLRRTLGWLDKNGNPLQQEIPVSYNELITHAGISRGAIGKGIEQAIAGGFVVRTRAASANSRDKAAQNALFMLRWDAGSQYIKDHKLFAGFYAGEGHRTPVPNSFFDHVLPQEPLSVIKVVGTVLRHTVGYQNQFGGRRSEAPLSYTYIQNYANMADRPTLSQAIDHATSAGYIHRVDAGCFHASVLKRRPATYAVRWLQTNEKDANGSKTQPAHRGQFKNPTSDGPETQPVERFKNPTKEKTERNTKKQQQEHAAADFDKASFSLLKNQGFDDAAARDLSGNHSRESIEQQVRWLDRRQASHNRLGMLRRAIEENWSEPASTAKDSEQAKLNRERGRYPAKDFRRQQQDKQARLERVAALRNEWKKHSDKERVHFHQQAIDVAKTNTERRLLLNHSDLTNPPLPSLEMMARDRAIPKGDSSHVSVSPTTAT